jgi:signal transduction histidine kinase
MFSSLRSRLILSYGLLILILMVVSTVILVYVVINVPIRNTTVRLQEITRFFSQQEPLGTLTQERSRNILFRTAQVYNVRLLLLDGQGRLVFDTLDGVSTQLEPIVIPGPETFEADRPVIFRSRDQGRRIWFYTMLPVDGHFLVLAAPRPPIFRFDTLRDELLPPLATASLISIVIAILLSFLMSRWISKPLQRMATSSRELSMGVYTPVVEAGPDEVRELAVALNDMISKVEDSQKSQRDFVANVSHDLKTPITAIQGFSQALLDGTVEDQAEVKRAAGVIHREAGRMHRLVLDLLDLAKLESGMVDLKKEAVDLRELLEWIGEKFGPQAAANGIELRQELDVDSLVVGDKDRLTQVFSNILDNAIKHSPAETKVFLRLHRSHQEVEVQIEDSGPGIPFEERSRIFERFYQLDKSRARKTAPGVGLGLAIARELVEAHQGSIEVLTGQTQGSVFVVKLPLASPNSPEPEA